MSPRSLLGRLVAVFLVLAAPAAADDQTAPASRPACADPEHRQFDFWIGDWEVYGARQPDRLAGRNRIEQASDGCALLESWVGTGGMSGKSLNFYDAETASWHQVWVGGDGTILRLKGGLHDNSIVLTGGERPSPQGRIRDRITWTPIENGTVRQHWEVSRDGGETWTTAFDGTYRRTAGEAPSDGTDGSSAGDTE